MIIFVTHVVFVLIGQSRKWKYLLNGFIEKTDYISKQNIAVPKNLLDGGHLAETPTFWGPKETLGLLRFPAEEEIPMSMEQGPF